jgi:muconate cycloisomerase
MGAAGAEGRCINAAACALELACRRWPVGDDRTTPIRARVSGVLGSADPGRTAGRLRLMRWYGLRDFKLKLGLGEDVDAENLRVVGRLLARAIRGGRCTLRVDVNGGWPPGEAPQRVAEMRRFGVCVVEQPATVPAGEIVGLADKCELPLMADESLLDEADARDVLADPRRIWWNVRISKNGGIDAALRLARLGAENGVPLTVGCMVGESGILSAAQRQLLQLAPQARFVEGNYGRFLLADDLTRPSPRFGYGGRLRPLSGPGLGLRVDEGKLRRYGTLVRTLPAS